MNSPLARGGPRGRAERLRLVATVAAVSLATAVLYAPVREHGFNLYDDPGYVVNNPLVRQGLSREGVSRAFTSTLESNWHPLTWLSHQADVQLFGMSAGAHHAVSALLHVANAALHVVVLHALTGALWPSAAVAALFALHPLHVESVAWVSERKDVLSTFFALSALLAWTGAARCGRASRAVGAWVLYALALTAKPMPVTLPLLLLLLDWWPLGRWSPTPGAPPSAARPLARFLPPAPLWKEKLPLFLIAAASAVVTYRVQALHGSIVPDSVISLPARLANVPVACVTYLAQTLDPRRLAIFYPHPLAVPPWWRWGGALVILALLLLALGRVARRWPFLPTGLLWFLGGVAPTLGIVQAGLAAHADRYTYLPLTGVFFGVAWAGRDLARTIPRTRPWLVVAAAAALAGCVALSASTLALWGDDRALLRRAIEITGPNHVAHNLLGVAAMQEGRPAEAVRHLEASVEALPSVAGVHRNLGIAHAALGRHVEAEASFRRALELDAEDAPALGQLGLLLAMQGRLAEAAHLLRAAAERQPGDAQTLFNLARVLGQLGDVETSTAVYRQVLALAPYDAAAENNLGQALALQGRLGEAQEHFARAAALDPDHLETRTKLARALFQRGRREEALAQLREVLRRDPAAAPARALMAEIFAVP